MVFFNLLFPFFECKSSSYCYHWNRNRRIFGSSLLEKQGYKISVFEKVAEPGVVGAGMYEGSRYNTEALKTYNAVRKSHINYYQRISHYIFPFFQSSNSYLSILRDPLFRLMCSNKITKKIMLQTFAGIRKGFLLQN